MRSNRTIRLTTILVSGHEYTTLVTPEELKQEIELNQNKRLENWLYDSDAGNTRIKKIKYDRDYKNIVELTLVEGR